MAASTDRVRGGSPPSWPTGVPASPRRTRCTSASASSGACSPQFNAEQSPPHLTGPPRFSSAMARVVIAVMGTTAAPHRGPVGDRRHRVHRLRGSAGVREVVDLWRSVVDLRIARATDIGFQCHPRSRMTAESGRDHSEPQHYRRRPHPGLERPLQSVRRRPPPRLPPSPTAVRNGRVDSHVGTPSVVGHVCIENRSPMHRSHCRQYPSGVPLPGMCE